MKQHHRFITTFLFLILQLPLLGNTGAVELFTKANSAYQKKDFQAAISGYEEIIKQGYKSDVVYFNLGNSYYKVNNISKAILNFERAKAIQPFDEDIQFNLRMHMPAQLIK
jgi:tetratricopeptide (TPR) repeat protein